MHIAILIYDEPDSAALRDQYRQTHLEQEPFYSNGVYKDINFHRWRFGRVMDRFK